MIIVTGETSRQLSEACESIEIRDSEGHLLGTFHPGASEADFRLFERLRQDGYPGTFSDFHRGILEVRRAMADPEYARDWKTTEQIMAKLKSLP